MVENVDSELINQLKMLGSGAFAGIGKPIHFDLDVINLETAPRLRRPFEENRPTYFISDIFYVQDYNGIRFSELLDCGMFS